jgi:hypothetical protein
MTAESQEQRRATNLEISQLLETMKASDSVELKMTVVPDQHRATVATLPIDPVEAQPRQVYFFDTPDLRLNEAGVVVRARRIQGGRGDTVVKLRPVVPADLPDELRKSPAFNVEVDVLPGMFGVCSASLKGRIPGANIRAAVRGEIPLRKVFSKDQRAFYKDHAPADLELEDLQVLGPTFILKSVFQATSSLRRFVAELWLYPDGSRILELSTKCLPTEAFQVAAEARGYLGAHGIEVGAGTQQTKTKTALEYFSAHLREKARPSLAADIALDGLATGDEEEALPSNADEDDDDDLPTVANSDDEADAATDRR